MYTFFPQQTRKQEATTRKRWRNRNRIKTDSCGKFIFTQQKFYSIFDKSNLFQTRACVPGVSFLEQSLTLYPYTITAMFTVDALLDQHYPDLKKRKLLSSVVRLLLRKILHEQAFIDFAEEYPHLQGIEFVEQVLEHFDFSYSVDDRQRENIPSSGRLMIIANHPIGSLDGLALLQLVHGIRTDVKIIANDMLAVIPPLKPMLLPVNNMNGNSRKTDLQKIYRYLEAGHATIIFPAGEVSRLQPKGILDSRWHNGYLKIARKTKSPLLPIHVAGRNSALFYLTSLFAKPLSTAMLVEEMFKQKEKQIDFTIGGLISSETLNALTLPQKEKNKLVRKHLYRIGKGKPALLKTETPIARGERRSDLKSAIRQGELLGQTPDDKTIYLFQSSGSSPLLREIGRLRETTFRAIGEGTGKRRDIDLFDQYYQHLIIWDEEDLEIAGAYRFVDSARIRKKTGNKGLYSGSLFAYEEKHSYFLDHGLELGRSFVQQRYWGTRSLDYLWYGIGAYLQKNPQYQYLFGPVSISNSMPALARDLMIYFYSLYFKGPLEECCSKKPFCFQESLAVLEKEFTGENYRADFTRLKKLLANLGTAVPPLYKQYTELCEPGGVMFLDFNIDPDFNDCVDGLVIVDTSRIKEKKRKRYIDGNKFIEGLSQT